MKNKLKGEINKALLVDSIYEVVFGKPATDNIIDLVHEYLYFYIHDNYRGL